MDINTLIKLYLKDYTFREDYSAYEDACIVNGCIALYKATHDEEYLKPVLGVAASLAEVKAEIAGLFRCKDVNRYKPLLFLLDETGEEQYRKAIDACMAKLWAMERDDCGFFKDDFYCPLENLYYTQPFYLAYESRFDGMAKLHDITNQFKRVHARTWYEKRGVNEAFYVHEPDDLPCGGAWLPSNARYLMALVDCIELSSEMLYEHYRALVDIFRQAVRGMLQYQQKDKLFKLDIAQPVDWGSRDFTETSGSAMVAYSLFKGVRLGVLNEEKYLPIAKEMFNALVKTKMRLGEDGKPEVADVVGSITQDPRVLDDAPCGIYNHCSNQKCDAKGMGAIMLAWAEYQMAAK